jgi:hypothetical protein
MPYAPKWEQTGNNNKHQSTLLDAAEKKICMSLPGINSGFPVVQLVV